MKQDNPQAHEFLAVQVIQMSTTIIDCCIHRSCGDYARFAQYLQTPDVCVLASRGGYYSFNRTNMRMQGQQIEWWKPSDVSRHTIMPRMGCTLLSPDECNQHDTRKTEMNDELEHQKVTTNIHRPRGEPISNLCQCRVGSGVWYSIDTNIGTFTDNT